MVQLNIKYLQVFSFLRISKNDSICDILTKNPLFFNTQLIILLFYSQYFIESKWHGVLMNLVQRYPSSQTIETVRQRFIVR